MPTIGIETDDGIVRVEVGGDTTPAPKRLLSVEEHNAQKIAERKAREEAMSCTGVACPKCGQEMRWVSPFVLMYPVGTGRQAECRTCRVAVMLEI